MTISADQLRCKGGCRYPVPPGYGARIRRTLRRLLGRDLTRVERKYLQGSEPYHWFQRAAALKQPICMDDPTDVNGLTIQGGEMLEAWFYAAFDRQRPTEPVRHLPKQQGRFAQRLRKELDRGRLVAPAFASRVSPARTVRPEGVRTGSPQAGDDRDGPARDRGADRP